MVRVNGGVPATIGILNGIARMGFSAEELIELTAAAGKPETRKVSRRDLASILALVLSRPPPTLSRNWGKSDLIFRGAETATSMEGRQLQGQ